MRLDVTTTFLGRRYYEYMRIPSEEISFNPLELMPNESFKANKHTSCHPLTNMGGASGISAPPVPGS